MILHTIGRRAPILLLAAAVVAAAASTQTAIASRLPRRIDLSSRVGVASQLKDGTVLALGVKGGGLIVPPGANAHAQHEHSDQYVVQEYTVDGELVRSIGTIGTGNKSLRWLGTCGTDDAAFVIDGNASTVIKIANGKTTTASITDGKLPDKAACANPTTFVVANWPTEALDTKTPYGAYRSRDLIDVRLNGRVIGRYKSDERFRFAKSDGPRPFGRQLLVAANTSRVFVGNNDTFSIDVFDLSGNRVGQINRPFTPRPFTEADRKAFLEAIGKDGSDSAFWRQFLPDSTFPAYDRLLTDSTGLWVQEPSMTDSVKTWRVFDNNGAYVKTVEVPATYELMQVSGGQMFGAWVNDRRAKSVAQYTQTPKAR